MPIEGPNLSPVQFEHPVGDIRYGNRWWGVRSVGKVLDTVVDQGGQRCQFVCRRAQPGLQNRQDALAQQQWIIVHGNTDVYVGESVCSDSCTSSRPATFCVHL